MDVFVRAENITAHIGDSTRRERVRTNLANFFTSLEAIPSDDELSETEESTDAYRDDGSDGVPFTTLRDIGNRERAKMKNLRDLHQEMQKEKDGDDSAGTAVIEVEPDLNGQGKNGLTPLHRAVLAGDLDLVSSLVARGARSDIPDRSGFTPLDRARFRADDSPTAGRIAALLEK